MLLIAMKERVRADDHVVAGSHHREISLSAPGPVMNQNPKRRSEPGQLAVPIAYHRSRADQQCWFIAPLGAQIEQERDGLDRLSQPHIVGKACAQPKLMQERKP